MNDADKLQIFMRYEIQSDDYILALRVTNRDGTHSVAEAHLPLNWGGDNGAFYNVIARVQGYTFTRERK